MKKSLMCSIVFLMAPVFANASDLTSGDPAKCIDLSAEKFGVPPDVLRSIIISDTKYKVGVNGILEAKPFEFHIVNKKILSEKGGFDWDGISKSTCASYSAVAWYLMNVSGGNEQKDIWEAVKVFFYGPNYKDTVAFSRSTGYNQYQAALKVYNELKGSDRSYHEKYNLWTSHKK